MRQNKQHDRHSDPGDPAGRCPEVYSNSISLHATELDLRTLFSRVASFDRQPGAAVGGDGLQHHVAVTLSWLCVKRYRDALTRAIGQYEAINGEIREAKFTVPTNPASQ